MLEKCTYQINPINSDQIVLYAICHFSKSKCGLFTHRFCQSFKHTERYLVYFCIIGAAFVFSFAPRREKTYLQGFVNNTVADQPAHPRSLIIAFVVRFVESIICKLAKGKISFF